MKGLSVNLMTRYEDGSIVLDWEPGSSNGGVKDEGRTTGKA